MSSQRYPEEFRIEAAKQILEHSRSAADVSRRLGVSAHSLYKWARQQPPAAQRAQQVSQSEELRRLKAELKRATEERDILKKRRRTSLVSPTEVRLYRQASGGLQRLADVPHAAAAPQRLLRLESQARKQARSG
jgi:transposase